MRLYQHILLLVAVLILAYPTACTEIACIIGPNGEKSVGLANITEYRGTDFVFFTDAADSNGGSESHKSQRTVDFAKEDINKKIDRGNDLVRTEGLKLVGKRSGPRRIDQICAIYDCLVAENNWTYVNDWKGLDQYQYANFTLDMGQQEGGLGKGDCDDFSILLASLIESIGATPRIVLAYGQTGGHAYTEVYLGKMSGQNRDLMRMINWLKSKYNVEDIYTHKDPDTGDIWLNLDWWKDAGGAKHPGGPFFGATDHVPIYIQEKTDKIPLTPIPNLRPEASFSWTPLEPEVDEAVSFSATQSHDPDGIITNYEWSFGDGDIAKGAIKSACRHIYSESGKFPVNLTITDNEGDTSYKYMEIAVNEPLPEAMFTYSPLEPVVGEVVTFDASQSKDKNGQITDYEWDFDDGYSGKRVAIDHPYWKSGIYKVKLTVTNNKGAKNSTLTTVTVGEKNEPTEATIQPYAATSPATQSTTEDVKSWFDEGIALASQGKYDEAIQAYDKAIEINPQDAMAWNNRGDALSQQGNYYEAIQCIDKAIELDPMEAVSWCAKGHNLELLERYDEAIQAYDKALDIDPQYALAWNNKGNILQKLGRTNESYAAFAKAEELGYTG